MARFAAIMCIALAEAGTPGSCHIKVSEGKALCIGNCIAGYACANGPSGCGCLKSDDPCGSLQANLNTTEPGSCHITVVDGHACCSGRCSKSGHHCGNGPSGCGCIASTQVKPEIRKSEEEMVGDAATPGSCHIKVKDGKALCSGRCIAGYACGNGPSGCGCLKKSEGATVGEAVTPGSCHINVKDGKALCSGRCIAGYACGNGPSGCGCLKSEDPCASLQANSNTTEPGSCHITVVDGHACCSGQCSSSGHHCGNGPSGCGCIATTLV